MTTPEPHRPRPAWSETPTQQLHLPPTTQALPPVDEPRRRRPRGLVPGLVVLALAGFAAFGVALGSGASYHGQSADPAPSTVSAPATTTQAPPTTAPSTTTTTPADPVTPVRPGPAAAPVEKGPAAPGPGRAAPAGPRG